MTTSNFEQIADLIIRREGGWVNDPDDRGGETIWGISKRAHPEMWRNGPPTKEQAREFYIAKYVIGPGFNKLPASHAKLQEQLIDYGVNSGPQLAIQKVQGLVGVSADGKLGPKTLAAIVAANPRELNNALVRERCKMAGRIVQRDVKQVKFLSGWLERFLSFID